MVSHAFVSVESVSRASGFGIRRRTHMAHTRQSRLDTGLGFPLTVLKSIDVVPASLGSGLIVLTVRGVWLRVGRHSLPVARAKVDAGVPRTKIINL